MLTFIIMFLPGSRQMVALGKEGLLVQVRALLVLLQNWLKRCESHDPGSFAPERKDPGFVLQYLWNEAINHIAVYYIISDAPKYGIIRTENSEMIDSFILEI